MDERFNEVRPIDDWAQYSVVARLERYFATTRRWAAGSEEDWRFSFVKLDFTLDTTELGFPRYRWDMFFYPYRF